MSHLSISFISDASAQSLYEKCKVYTNDAQSLLAHSFFRGSQLQYVPFMQEFCLRCFCTDCFEEIKIDSNEVIVDMQF